MLGVCILVPLESSGICRFCILEVRLGDAVACILLEMKMKWKYKIAHYAYSDPDSYLSRLVVLGDLVSVPPPPGSLLREPRQAPAVPFTASPAFCRYCVSQGLWVEDPTPRASPSCQGLRWGRQGLFLPSLLPSHCLHSGWATRLLGLGMTVARVARGH